MCRIRSMRLLALEVVLIAAILGAIVLHLRGAPAGTRTVHPAAPAISSPDGPVPAAIRATVHRGRLALTLMVTPVDVGPARFVVSVKDGGRPVHDAQVRIRLSMPAQPVFGSTMPDAARCAGNYCAQGTLQALGRWRVDVRVRLREPRAAPIGIPFDLMNGAYARFLFAEPPDKSFGPATVTLTRSDDGSSELQVRLRPRLTVRAVLDIPNMRSMGTAVYAASPLPHGRYAVSLAFPMAGVSQVVIQVQANGRWHTVHTLLYDVDSAGQATLLTLARP